MNCDEIRPILSAYLDDELDAAQQGMVRSHIQRCADCRAEVESLSATAGLVWQLPRVPAPDSVLAEFNDRLARESLLKPTVETRMRSHVLRRVAALTGITALAATLLIAAHLTFFSSRRAPSHADWSVAEKLALRADLGGEAMPAKLTPQYADHEEVSLVLVSQNTSRGRLALANAISNSHVRTLTANNEMVFGKLGLMRESALETGKGDEGLKLGLTRERMTDKASAPVDQVETDDLVGMGAAQSDGKVLVLDVTPDELNRILAELHKDTEVAVSDFSRADQSWQRTGQDVTLAEHEPATSKSGDRSLKIGSEVNGNISGQKMDRGLSAQTPAPAEGDIADQRTERSALEAEPGATPTPAETPADEVIQSKSELVFSQKAPATAEHGPTPVQADVSGEPVVQSESQYVFSNRAPDSVPQSNLEQPTQPPAPPRIIRLLVFITTSEEYRHRPVPPTSVAPPTDPTQPTSPAKQD